MRLFPVSAHRFSSRWWILPVISLAVIYPRVVLLGDFPHMDEGLFVFLAALSGDALATGAPLPMMHGLTLEGALLGWTSNLPGPMFLWLRICDLVFASIAGCLLCSIYQRECGSKGYGLVLALLFLCPMNYASVIDAGYKNQLPVAFCFLFLAFILAASPGRRCFLAGIATALAVLFREPFFVFAFLGFFSIWVAYGCKHSLLYALGGLATAVAALGVLYWLQGGINGIEEIIESYAARSAIYASEKERIVHNFYSGLYKSLMAFTAQIIFSIISVAITFAIFRNRREMARSRGLAVFWLAAFTLPLLETCTKISFLYHFAICLPALGGLCACFWRLIFEKISTLPPAGQYRAKIYAGILSAACCIMTITGLPEPSKAEMTLALFKNLPALGWPAQYEHQSNTLLAAREIRKLLPEGGSLATSGFTFFLYEASGAMPPTGSFDPADKYKLSDMSRSWLLLGKDARRFSAALRSSLPDVLVIARAVDTHEPDYADELRQVVDISGLYRLEKIISPNGKLNYGWLEYYIYARKKARACI